MTITPVPVRPAASSGPAPRDGRPAGDAAGFADLVSREADRLAGGPRAASGVGDGSADADGGTAPAAAGDVPAGAPLLDVVAPGVVVGVVPGSGAPRGQAEAASTDVEVDAAADAAADGQVGLPGGDVVGTAAAPAGLPTQDADEGSLLRPGAAAPNLANDAARVPEGTAAPGVVPGAPGTGEVSTASATSPEVAAPGMATSPASPAPSATAGSDLAGPPVTGGPAAVTGAESTGPNAPTAETARTTTALLEQVSPTLTRLVSRGDGEHRMTLKIHPADLGEVHLTVTVRGERVDVDIAASAEARELLRDGLLQLRALLDPTGRGGGQLVFRDLPTAPAPGQPVSAETSTSGDPGDRSGASDGSAERHEGRGSHGDRSTARTSAAADPGGPTAPPPTRQGGSGARTVDLTI